VPEVQAQTHIADLYEHFNDYTLTPLRKKIWDKDFNGQKYGLCPICHERAMIPTDFVAAHIGAGNDKSLTNLRAICYICHKKHPKQSDGYSVFRVHLDDYETQIMEKIRRMEQKGLLKILPIDYTPRNQSNNSLPPIHRPQQSQPPNLNHNTPQQSVVPPTHVGLDVAQIFHPSPLPVQHEVSRQTSSTCSEASDSECDAPETPN
jgi:hypothetical protein